ncbi:MAG TPA: hypothetical protein VL022_02630 [Moheibacter sp.]|nr:hypothetical protein [Moheibacter sp.]
MNILQLVPFLSLLFLGFTNIKPDYLNWSADKKISFADFKAQAPKGKSAEAVSLSTLISYEIRQEAKKPPQIKIANLLDRNASWIKTKNQDILAIQQIKFDYSELYARKIRKEIKSMNQKKVTDQKKYLQVITHYSNQFEKTQRKRNVLLQDQPHLIKIMQKDIKDSLNLMKAFVQ